MARTINSVLEKHAVEVGDCLEWTGAFSGKTPIMKEDGGKSNIAVRRWIALKEGMTKGKIAKCGCSNWRCVKPEHTAKVGRVRFYSDKGRELAEHPLRPVINAKIAAARRNSPANKVGREKAQVVREDTTKTSAQWAEELSIHPHSVDRIRGGRAYRPVEINPFLGLMR